MRIEAYGTVDELNAVLGLARSAQLPAEIDVLLARSSIDCSIWAPSWRRPIRSRGARN